ncbi:MAG: adenylate/guanylate cyclase domain-containing protein, partial [Planctomycetes bacterium]|nr:adenylate/guanylate cyclase domain-containing protein [Planctomycetota bacterium]
MNPLRRMPIGFQTKLTLILILLTTSLVVFGGAMFYGKAMGALMGEFRQKLIGVAATAGAMLDLADHETLRTTADEGSAAHLKLRAKLLAARRANDAIGVSGLYTMRLEGQDMVFVIDALEAQKSASGVFKTQEPARIGERFEEPTAAMWEAFREKRPSADERPAADKWGVWLSGFAPILDERAGLRGIVGVDASAQTVRSVRWQLAARGALALMVSVLLSCGIGWLTARTVTGPLRTLMAGLAEVKAGNLNARVDITSRDEFQDLGEAFNGMVKGLREREQIKGAMVRHLSRQVAQKILEHPDTVDLGGERVDATVLFADVRDFTPISEGMDPREVVSLLNDYFQVVVEAVMAEEGTLDKFLGDGVMAVFGAPLEQKDHALRAARCGLAIQEAIGKLNQTRAPRGAVQLHMGIGINTGEMLAGQVGSRQRLEYTVIGREVNKAQRIQTVAGPGEVLLSDRTLERVKPLVQAEDAGVVSLKGLTEPVPVY